LLNVRRLMNERENWKEVMSKKDYQYLGVFSSAQMQCVFFAPDHTKLQHSPDGELHFMWHDVQLSKRKLNKDRLIEIHIGSCVKRVFTIDLLLVLVLTTRV